MHGGPDINHEEFEYRTSGGWELRHEARRAVLWIGIAVAIVTLALFLWYAVDVLLLTFAGVLAAVFLRSLSHGLSVATRLPEGAALAILALVLVGIGFGVVRVVVPPISDQIDQLTVQLPKSLDRLEDFVGQHEWGRWILSHLPKPEEFVARRPDLLSKTTGIASRTLGIIASVVLVMFLAIYFALEPRLYQHGLLHLLPKRSRPRARELFSSLEHTVSWWLIGMVISMAAIGLLTWLGLWFLGVPLALTLAIFAGLLTFVPNFGPIIAVIPAALLALLDSPAKAGYVLLLYLGIQAVETYLLMPMVQRRTVNLAPALTILGQVVMGVLAGVFGVILATPLLAVVLVTVKMLYVQDTLMDQIEVARPPEDRPVSKNKTASD